MKLREPKRGGLLEGFLSRERAKIANRLIPRTLREGRILDIGCGESAYFLLHTDFREKYGLERLPIQGRDEVSKEGVQILNRDIEYLSVLPFPDEHFSVITMLAVFEHIEPKRLPDLLNEIYRVLQRGGMYILTTPAAWTDRLLRTMAWIRLIDPVLVAEHKDAYTHGKIRSVFLNTHFSERRLSLGYFECFLNCWATAVK